VRLVAIYLCVASQDVMPKVSVYFVIDSFRKLLDTPSYLCIDGTIKMDTAELGVGSWTRFS